MVSGHTSYFVFGLPPGVPTPPSMVRDNMATALCLEDTVVSDQKPLVGRGCPVAVGNHVSAEIPVTRHPGHLSDIPSRLG